jgi:DNA-directed RNA polymerase I subunit RPA2
MCENFPLRSHTRAHAQASIVCRVDGRELDAIDARIGMVPVMLCSAKCHLRGMTTRQLVAVNEEPAERGGYFVINGSEKIVRCVVVQRRNYPLAMDKERYRARGPLYSPFALSMRSCRRYLQV